MKLKNILTELKSSKWPTKVEIVQLTIYTLILCAIIAAIMVGLDLILFKLRDWFLNV
jgi:preprotein translocase subunit SecE